MLADGSVSEGEIRLIQSAVLRVMPLTERERAKAKIADANARERQELDEAEDLPTQRQLEYIRDLGGICPAGTTKWEASEIIDQLIAKRPTVRQRMVLRFWNRLDLMTQGVEGVSNWLDGWYAADPDRVAAWELWKREVDDTGGRSPAAVDSVPLGAGEEDASDTREGAKPANPPHGKRPARRHTIRRLSSWQPSGPGHHPPSDRWDGHRGIGPEFAVSMPSHARVGTILAVKLSGTKSSSEIRDTSG